MADLGLPMNGHAIRCFPDPSHNTLPPGPIPIYIYGESVIHSTLLLFPGTVAASHVLLCYIAGFPLPYEGDTSFVRRACSVELHAGRAASVEWTILVVRVSSLQCTHPVHLRS